MNMCQAHSCRLTGDHMAGLECLSDSQILPILFAMDPDTLLSFGGANRRLHRLVCDIRVWRHLLKEVESFTSGTPQIGQIGPPPTGRLKELVELGRALGSLEMRVAEVVKEVASRFKISLAVDEDGNNYIVCGKKGEETHLKNFSKVAVSVQGWGAPLTFEIGGEDQLNELHKVARAVGAKFSIKEVKAFPFSSSHTTDLLAMLLDEQQWRGEEGLCKLELSYVKLDHSYLPKRDPSLALLKASEEWKIENLAIGLERPLPWRALAQGAATGHIGTLKFSVDTRSAKQASKEDVKAVWEITEKMEVVVIDGDNPGAVIQVGGGRGKESKMTWEKAYQTVLYNMC